ncbi:hypothetical protein CC85DRAFT_80912 [Cutaneotrichosporon oleaginosum]|uniref:Uncharacterized protein n=1 Tax=Cutaneotrichosporon oleaginosum TaxID=879819 RepID=A0A0J1B4N1_9TREE|nr:uncharacterized protein CC85DRAFT_80912 [Cutaneotrichosporon oleaginosum]KLT42634.1 hypothetical protein CC85DRAFT_80912 [Cutaneotrichosporon oleaginosum]TXT05249.1 hypothetical protein COLE_06569 [Cutaneotrichosporon oleaginosum]
MAHGTWLTALIAHCHHGLFHARCTGRSPRRAPCTVGTGLAIHCAMRQAIFRYASRLVPRPAPRASRDVRRSADEATCDPANPILPAANYGYGCGQVSHSHHAPRPAPPRLAPPIPPPLSTPSWPITHIGDGADTHTPRAGPVGRLSPPYRISRMQICCSNASLVLCFLLPASCFLSTLHSIPLPPSRSHFRSTSKRLSCPTALSTLTTPWPMCPAAAHSFRGPSAPPVRRPRHRSDSPTSTQGAPWWSNLCQHGSWSISE